MPLLVKATLILALLNFIRLSGAISQCFNCCVVYCRALWGSFRSGLAGKLIGTIIKEAGILSILRYSYPFPLTHIFKPNSLAIFEERSIYNSLFVLNTNGPFWSKVFANASNERSIWIGSLSSGYFAKIF